MNAAAWIAIAAIIVASINSWGQFLLKERSEKQKALAAANPATNQPKAVIADKTEGGLTFGRFIGPHLRQNWFPYLVQFIANTSAITLVLSLRKGSLPVNSSSIALLVYAMMLVIPANVKMFRPLK